MELSSDAINGLALSRADSLDSCWRNRSLDWAASRVPVLGVAPVGGCSVESAPGCFVLGRLGGPPAVAKDPCALCGRYGDMGLVRPVVGQRLALVAHL